MVAVIDEIESFYEEQLVKSCLKKSKFNKIQFVNRNFEEIIDNNPKRIFVICKK